MAIRTQTRSQIWSEFRHWCAQRKMKALPAHPWTIAAYLRLIDRRLGAKDAQATLDAITREHVLKTMRTPMSNAIVVRTMEMIERRGEVRDQHAALFDDEDALGEAPKAAPPPEKEPEPEAKRVRRMLSTEPRLTRRRPRPKG